MKRMGILVFAFLCFLWSPSSLQAEERFTLMLDWFPNVDHLPLYVAQQDGLFAREGLFVEFLSPSETSDALKLAASNQVDMAVAYEPQTIIAAARGLKIQAIGRLIEHPLTTLLFLKGKGISKPADLTGKRIGYTVPGMMDVLMEAFARINGIGPYSAINVGFSIVQSLTANRVDAIMGPYKNYETVELEHKGFEPAYFALEEWGIPDYDELVFVAGPKALETKARALQAFTRVVDEAIALTRSNPQRALETYFKAVPEAPVEMEREAFKRTLPVYARTQALDPSRWQRFADFALQYGLIEKPVNVKTVIHPWAP